MRSLGGWVCLGVALSLLTGLDVGVARADSCAVPLYREHRPGPWPALLPGSDPIAFVSDTPHQDLDPGPAGTTLTLYRLGDPSAGADPLVANLLVERVGDQAVLQWSGGGEPRGCCLPDGCMDLCPLDCLSAGGQAAAAGVTCDAAPAPCAIDPCGAVLDFTGNAVPPGWFVLERDGNTNETSPSTIEGERLETSPVNRGRRVVADVVLPSGVQQLVVEFDVLHDQSQWGMYAEFQLFGPVGRHGVVARSAVFEAGPETLEFWTEGPSGGAPKAVESISYGPHHHRLIFADGQVARLITDSGSGAVVADLIQDLPDFVVSTVDRLVWEVYVTTENSTWGDDFSLTCLP